MKKDCSTKLSFAHETLADLSMREMKNEGRSIERNSAIDNESALLSRDRRTKFVSESRIPSVLCEYTRDGTSDSPRTRQACIAISRYNSRKCFDRSVDRM